MKNEFFLNEKQKKQKKIIGSEMYENIHAWSPSYVGQKRHGIFLQNEKWIFKKWKTKQKLKKLLAQKIMKIFMHDPLHM